MHRRCGCPSRAVTPRDDGATLRDRRPRAPTLDGPSATGHHFGGVPPGKQREALMGARTGEQFLEKLRKTRRTVWVGDERVDDVTAHPALAGAASTLADVFDRQHRYAEECLITDAETR